MPLTADSFGDFEQGRPQSLGMWAARAFDHVVTWAIVLVLAVMCGVSGYALWDSANLYDTSLQDSEGNALTFAQALAENPDVCAWLTIDNTGIDYPVVQGTDDFEYLSKDALGNDSSSGSIFLDSACSRQFDEPYEMIMGHHMQYSKMFGDLDKFLDADFFGANQTGRLLLPDKTLDLQICAVVKANAYDAVFYRMPADASRMPQLLQQISRDALFQREGLTEESQILALSTCSSSGTDERTIVMCRVVGEHVQQNV